MGNRSEDEGVEGAKTGSGGSEVKQKKGRRS